MTRGKRIFVWEMEPRVSIFTVDVQPTSSMFKTMGYSPGGWKSANLGPFRIHSKSIRRIPHSVIIPFASRKGAFQGVWSVFRHTLYQIPPCSKPWAIAAGRPVDQNRPISHPCKFTRNPHEQSSKHFEIQLPACCNRSRKFGTIPSTYPNPPLSDPVFARPTWTRLFARTLGMNSLSFRHCVNSMTARTLVSPKEWGIFIPFGNVRRVSDK